MAGLVAASMLVVIISPLLTGLAALGEDQGLSGIARASVSPGVWDAETADLLAIGDDAASRFAAPVRFLASPIASSCGGTDNLIRNGGFEQGTEGWYQNGTVEPTTDAHDGSAALRLGTRDADGYIDQRISLFTAGVPYTLSGWGTLSVRGDTGQIGIEFLDRNGNRMRADEPVPLTFSGTSFVHQEFAFVVPPGVAEVYVFANKDDGAGSFVVDTLSLTTTCAPPGSPTPPAATPEGATSPPASPVAPAATPGQATPEILAASPVVSGAVPLTYYVDAEANLSIGYPADWRPLTAAEVRAQIEISGHAPDVATTAHFVAVSPDGRAAIVYSRLLLPEEQATLDDVVQAVQEADAASIAGIGAMSTEPVTLGGVPAVLVRFSAADPVTGAPGERSIRQIVAIHDDAVVVLTSIVQRGASPALEETVRQVEEYWRWGPAP